MRALPDSLVRELLEWHEDLWFHPLRFTCSAEESFEGMRILDAGCRFGRMAVYFALLGAEVVGVDANAESLAEAKRVIEAYGVADRVNLVQMDLHSLGFADQSFNVVFTKSTLIMTDPIRVVEGLRRLLKPGGRAIFLENLLGHRIMQLARRRRGDWVRRAKWLTMEDVEKICAMFPRAAHKEFHLLSASYHWLRKLLPNQRLLEFLMYIDDRLLRWVPAWREKCYITAIVAYT